MQFNCQKCSTPVVLGSDPRDYSDDVKEQCLLRLCTRCWKISKSKEPTT